MAKSKDTAEPPAPYAVEYSGLVLGLLRELSQAAAARGDGPAFRAALQEFDRLLRLYPQFGEPLIDLNIGGGQIRLGIIRPLSMRYGVYEESRLVICAARFLSCSRWTIPMPRRPSERGLEYRSRYRVSNPLAVGRAPLASAV